MIRPHVAILTGGTSSEREVALQSATGVRLLLENVCTISVFDFPGDIERFLSFRHEIDVAIPIFHGKDGEDGTIQGFLKILDIPFLFSGIEAQAIALNKALTKQLVERTGIYTAKYQVFRVGDKQRLDLAFPVVIKPMDGGSSIGITITQTPEEFDVSLKAAFEYGDTVLVEEFVKGDEYTVAIIEEKGCPVALPVIAIRSKTAFFDFQSKYDASLVEEVCPAPIADDLRQRLQETAVSIHQLIGAKHLTRSDFIVDAQQRICFLEINTIPGQTINSLVPKAIRASGRDASRLFLNWIQEVAVKIK